MPAAKRNPWRRPFRHRFGAGLALISYLAGFLGFPLPPAAGGGKSGVAFCRGGHCGCSSEEKSRGQCCCFSRNPPLTHQRVQRPPAPSGKPRPVLEAQGKGRLRSCCQRTPGTPRPPCCQRQQQKTSPARRSCCAPRPGCLSCERPHSLRACRADSPGAPRPIPRPAPPPRLPVRLGLSALGCQDLPLLWVNSGAAVPAPAPATWRVSQPPAGWLAAGSVSGFHTPLVPPDPPPRTAA
jgi:hypothetical protein